MNHSYTASGMHQVLCEADGLSPEQQQSLLTRLRYIAKRHLLQNGEVVDQRGTLAFPKIEVFRAAIFCELAGLAMDVRTLKQVTDAAAQENPRSYRQPPSMFTGSGYFSRGGLIDSINGVAVDEAWTLRISLAASDVDYPENRIVARFLWVDGQPETSTEFKERFRGLRSRTFAEVDLKALFGPIIQIVGVPDDA